MAEFEKLGDILKRMGYPVDFEEAGAALTADIHKNSKDHGWWESEEDKSIPAKLMLIVTEIAEAMEEYRNVDIDELPIGYVEMDAPGKPDKPCGFGVELADAMIRIRDVCGYLKIDIDKLVNEKHEYNKTREYRHGGKRA